MWRFLSISDGAFFLLILRPQNSDSLLSFPILFVSGSPLFPPNCDRIAFPIFYILNIWSQHLQLHIFEDSFGFETGIANVQLTPIVLFAFTPTTAIFTQIPFRSFLFISSEKLDRIKKRSTIEQPLAPVLMNSHRK